MTSRATSTVALLALCGAFVPTEVFCQERPWYLVGSISYRSTSDDIRSNASIVFTEQFGDDGMPFTGDPNELVACQPNPGNFYPVQDPFCDPRPDDLLAREGSIKDDFELGLAIGYQVTHKFGLQLELGYTKTEVGPVDIYQQETIPVRGSDGLPSRLMDERRSTPASAGDLTQIPASLSGLIRFRNSSQLRPYIGAGLGAIFTEFSTDAQDELTALIELINQSRVRGFGNEFGRELTDPSFNGTLQKEDGGIPFALPFSVEIDDALEWHLMAGIEYVINNRMSVVLDARYITANQNLELDLGGQDQLDIIYWPSQLYRSNGTLEVYVGAPSAPNATCFDSARGGVNEFRFGCYQGNRNTRVNPEGKYRDIFNPDRILTGAPCPATGDFNRDGQVDVCYPSSWSSGSGHPVTGIWIVQGGTIDLTAFSVGLAVKFNF